MKARVIWLLSIVLLLSGCAQQNKKQKPFSSEFSDEFTDLSSDDIIRQQHDHHTLNGVQHTITDHDTITQYEAKLSDIPLPLSLKSISLSYTQQNDRRENVMLEYRVSMPYDHVKTFYEDEMERLGWSHVHTFGTSSHVMYFTKPDYACAVFVEALSHKKSRLLIFLDT